MLSVQSFYDFIDFGASIDEFISLFDLKVTSNLLLPLPVIFKLKLKKGIN
jgi:hypothetical protein